MKTALITGATSGIGKAVATELARQGFTVVIHGRNAQKTSQVCEEIKMISGNTTVDYLVADLFLMEQVRKLAGEYHQRYGRLDVLVNNAGGLMSKERETTTEGIEKTMAVNVMAPFLLTGLLLDLLKNSPDGRIINVSSNSHKLNAKPDFSDLQLERGYDPLRAYGNAKLFLIWLTQQLSKQLKRQGIDNVTVNAVHPGAVATNFGVESNLGSVLKVMAKLARPFFRTAEQGADTLIYLASSDAVNGKSGLYFVDRKPANVTTTYYTEEREQLIWDHCRQLTKSLVA